MTYHELSRLLESKPKGPRPFFHPAHLVRYLDLVESRPRSRQELARRLGLGEGSVRTITSLLRSRGIIRVGRSGARLTEEGFKVLSSLRKEFSKGIVVPQGASTIDAQNVAILVRGAAGKASLGIEQRDAAISTGATGASTFVYKGGKLSFPGMYPDLCKADPELAEKLMDGLRPKEGDVIVIGSGPDLDTAHVGAIAAAATLL